MAVRPRHRESWRRCCSARLALWGFLWVDTAGFERTLATRRDLAVSLRRLGATCWGDRRTGTEEDGPILQTSALPLGYGAGGRVRSLLKERSSSLCLVRKALYFSRAPDHARTARMPRCRPRGDHIGRLDRDGLTDVPEPAGAGRGPVRNARDPPRRRHPPARSAAHRARRTGAGAGLPPGCSRARLHHSNRMPDRRSSDAGTHQGFVRSPCGVPLRPGRTGLRIRILPRSTTLSTASSLSRLSRV